jgi:hypothetical protein
VAGGLVVAVLLAACSASGPHPAAKRGNGQNGVVTGGRGFLFVGGPSGSRPAITVGAIPPAGSGLGVVLPLNAYEQVVSQEQDSFDAATGLLTQQCMTARGFSYQVAAAPSGSSLAALQDFETADLGVTSLTQAETYGYASPGRVPGAPLGALFGVLLPNVIKSLKSHSTAWIAALLGITPGGRVTAKTPEGCLQEVINALPGGASNFVTNLALDSVQWTQTDPRVRQAERAWSACMAAHGYKYANPLAPTQAKWPSAPTRYEVATAVTDVTCKQRVNLTNTWLAVEAAYQQALIGQNLAALSHLQARFDTELAEIQQLLTIGGLTGGHLPGRLPGGPGVRVNVQAP